MSIDSSLVSELSTQGVYSLLLFASEEIVVTVGKLGIQKFPRGHYTYTGSALGKGTSVKNRILRHLNKEKQMFWHIDYLLTDKNVSVKAIVVAETNEKIECILNSYLKNSVGAKILVKGFGSSDCKSQCGSHLLYFSESVDTKKLIQQLVGHLQTVSGVLSVVVID